MTHTSLPPNLRRLANQAFVSAGLLVSAAYFVLWIVEMVW